ncbi:uncharacterized protein LOC124435398 [Xenia sp. Carnegie-2017]|uniref:uncharacterized protein LOC124435398 n=1 Tax=Xenia sp. Carnegie-2017 TaxID=2897299 RepID=UPI001F048055|nr:uncharacterized protein LOC124435398 [Xenia sp. Carnegie-2017]
MEYGLHNIWKRNALFSVDKLLLNYFSRFKVGRKLFSTSSTSLKGRRGTVGIPSWAKAANKRRAQVILLDKEKTPAQFDAEIRLADDKSTKFDFFTTSRVGVHKPNASNVMENGKSISTSNGNMIIFYHPRKNYSSEDIERNSNDLLHKDLSQDQRASHLTDTQISEIRSLRKLDPKLWTVDMLANMYKVEPLDISDVAPLNTSQQLHLEVEQEFLATLSDYEKVEYSYFKDNERKKQLRKFTKEG